MDVEVRLRELRRLEETSVQRNGRLDRSDAELAEFEQHLQDLGYPYADESVNPAYRMFLA